MKVQDLTGVQLDWAVAKAEGDLSPQGDVMVLEGRLFSIEPGGHETPDIWRKYNPTDSWHLAGPIIEREGITLRCGLHGWDAELEEFDAISHGTTALIAAMRCYVSAKLGDEINIPEELAP